MNYTWGGVIDLHSTGILLKNKKLLYLQWTIQARSTLSGLYLGCLPSALNIFLMIFFASWIEADNGSIKVFSCALMLFSGPNFYINATFIPSD